MQLKGILMRPITCPKPPPSVNPSLLPRITNYLGTALPVTTGNGQFTQAAAADKITQKGQCLDDRAGSSEGKSSTPISAMHLSYNRCWFSHYKQAVDTSFKSSSHVQKHPIFLHRIQSKHGILVILHSQSTQDYLPTHTHPYLG